MSRIRILFCGTPEFAVPSLKALYEDEHFEIVSVISQPDRPAGRKRQLKASPVKQAALELGLEVITPEKVKAPEVLEQLKEYKAEAAVVVAFGQILPQAFLDLFTFGAVNIHSSLLPRWRGAAPMQRALIAGDKESGVSLQKIVLKLDAGDVLGERRVLLDENINAIELHDQLKELSCELLTIDFMDYLRGNLAGKPQDESLVTHAAKLEKSEGEILWTEPAETIHNKVRGLCLGPGTWTNREGKKLKIHRTQVVSKSGAAGEVLAIEDDGFVVGCGENALKVLEVQPESKAKMVADVYLRGYKLNVGEKLS